DEGLETLFVLLFWPVSWPVRDQFPLLASRKAELVQPSHNGLRHVVLPDGRVRITNDCIRGCRRLRVGRSCKDEINRGLNSKLPRHWGHHGYKPLPSCARNHLEFRRGVYSRKVHNVEGSLGSLYAGCARVFLKWLARLSHCPKSQRQLIIG